MAKAVDTTIGPVTQVQDLTAGVNLNSTPTTIKPNGATKLLNADISSAGELGILAGWLSFSTSSLGSRRVQGGKRIYLASDQFTLAADNGSVYKPSDGGVWGAAVLAGLHATNQVDFVYDRDIVAAFDGSTVPKKSKNGTTWTQLGISPPLAAAGLSAVAGGTLINGNTYEVAYAYRDSTLNQVGNISATATQVAAGANLTVRAAVTASTDPAVDGIRIYVRDVTSGETVLRLQGTYANTTTNRDITSNNWAAQEEAPTDHTVAVPCSFGCVWKNRWWLRDATVKNRLRFSQIFQPQSYPSTFYVDIPFERGDDITGVLPLGDTLVVFGYTRFYLILGQTSLDFEVRPALGSQTGALGFRSSDVLENGVVHAGAEGIYLFNGASDELLSYLIEPAWRAVMANNSAAELALVPLLYHKKEKQVRVAVPNLYPTTSPGEWILDLNRSRLSSDGDQSWTGSDRTVGGYIHWDGNEVAVGNHGRLVSWSRTLVKLFEENSGATADGNDRQMDYEGYVLPMGIQQGRIIDTYIEVKPTQGTLTINLRIDGRLMAAQDFDLGAGLALYGIARYGIDTYAEGNRKTIPVMWPLRAEGQTAQLTLRYVGHGDPKIYTYGHNVFKEPLPRGIRN